MNQNACDIVIQEFLKLTEIPRPSHHEARVAAYLMGWAKEKGIEAKQDTLGQVILSKPASKGCEGKPTVLLQAHMDMVCVADEGVQFDPMNDPIKVINDGEYLTADGTSLGADDGIGIAMALYLLQDESLKHGPLKVIFTVNEEDGMTSMEMDPADLAGDYLINLDWEEIGSLCNSCAGGDFFNYTRKADWEKPAAGSIGYTIGFNYLLGGHSGVGINKGHANALVSVATALNLLRQGGVGFQVASFTGGQAKNAIPAQASAAIAIAKADQAKAEGILKAFYAEFQDAFGAIETAAVWTAEAGETPEKVLSEATGYGLIDAMASVPNNVHTMSPFIDGLVESSANLGVISLTDEMAAFTVFARSSVAYQATQIGMICRTIAERTGFTFEAEGHVPGWAVNPKSKLVPVACEAYKALTGQEMVVEPVHAGVECGAFAEKNPKLDMIAIGPTLIDVHSPAEKCALKDVETTTDLLVEILKRLAD